MSLQIQKDKMRPASSTDSTLFVHQSSDGQWWTGAYQTYSGFCSVYRQENPDSWEARLICNGREYWAEGHEWKSDRQLAIICNRLSGFAQNDFLSPNQ